MNVNAGARIYWIVQATTLGEAVREERTTTKQ